ncbi:hypothetical protein [Streptomyces sp. NPDC004685]
MKAIGPATWSRSDSVPGAVATARIRLVVKAASRTWDDLCVNEITTR